MAENTDNNLSKEAYWKANMYVVFALLAIWFFVSYGCGILFRDWFDANFPNVGGAPFGFWMAQQGSIISFVILLIVYKITMNKIDHKYNYDEGEAE